MNRGVGVVLYQLFADDDRVFEVVSLERHEGHQHVATEGQFPLERCRPIGDDIPFFHFVAGSDDRLLVLTGPLVEPDKLTQLVDLRADLNPLGIDVGDSPLVASPYEHAAMPRHVAFQASPHDGGLGHQQRHRLSLHVGAHEGAIGVVMLQEGNESGRHADHLARRDVHVLDPLGWHEDEVGLVAGDDRIPLELVVLHRRVGRGDIGLVLLVGPQPHDVVGELGILHHAVGGDEEAVVVNGSIHREARNKPDVRSFRCLDGTDSAVVRDVDVADLEPGPFAIETPWAEGREATFVGEHRQRIGLVDHLRQLAPPEEVLDRRRNALGINQAPRGHILLILETHPLLDGAAEFEEPLAEFVGRQFVDRP